MELVREKKIQFGDYNALEAPRGEARMKTILIIEDDELLLPLILCGLGMHLKDFHVLSAENGREAIEILESVPVDALVTDLNMPEIDGYALLAYIREHKPDIRTFAMTGDYNSEVNRRLLSLGVEECFEKPFNFREAALKISRNGIDKSIL